MCIRDRFHTDAVQAVGNMPIDVKALHVDLLSLSGHKLYGPKGIGAIYIRTGVRISPLISGGHQERGKRAGTENVPGIVGLGKAIEMASANLNANVEKLTKLRNYYLDQVEKRIPHIRLNSSRENCCLLYTSRCV